MDNLRLSWLLEEAAALMEIKGENPFKVRAFQNGARIVAGLPRSFQEMLDDGELAQTSGIGKGLLGQIKDYAQSGSLNALDELRQEIPEGVAEFLHIPGVGPKMARTFYDKLGVTTVADLEDAARARKVRELKGLGGKTEMSLLRSIERMRQRSGRTSTAIARPLANEVKSLLESLSCVETCTIAGSLRRQSATVKDLDVLVVSDQPEQVIEVFVALPYVQEITGQGSTKASVVFKAGLNGDLRVLTAEQFACGLHYFTGSKAHNIRMRQIAKEQGYTLNEYSLTNTQTGQETPIGSESDLFRCLGLAYIEPELREDRGEIEAAQQGTLPQRLTVEHIQGDLHMHTVYSDGANTVAEMAEAARAMGHKYIAICDHSRSLKIANGMSVERLLRQRDEIRQVSKEMNFPILSGVECDILADGSLDYEDDLLAQLDIVVASIHSGFQQEEHQLTQRLIRAIEHPYVHIIGHPTGRMLGQREPYPVDMDAVIAAAKRQKKILEINATPERFDLNETYAAMCREQGVPVAINTDAHRTEQLRYVESGVAYARRAWLEPKHVANTWPLEDLLAYIGK